MEHKQVIEGNVLIAGFMGKQHIDYICEYCDRDVREFAVCDGNEDGYTRSHSLGGLAVQLYYHSSWSWLMPVVEKLDEMVIPKTLIDSDYPEHVFTNLYGKSFCICVGDSHKIFEAKGESKIASTWKAVTDFIQWHNDAKIKAMMKDEAKYGNRQWE